MLGIASRRARANFYRFLGDITHDELRHYLTPFCIFTRQYSQAFIRILDILTLHEHKTVWIEKTPAHLHHINDISKLVSEVKFIHLIRNGEDVVASLYEVGETWKGRSVYDIDNCIKRWIQSIMISHNYIHKPNHILVRYENLVEEPRIVLSTLCKFIGVSFEEIMLKEYRNASEQLVLEHEMWKTSVRGVIQSANHKKFYRLFNEEQRRYIQSQISKIDLEELSSLSAFERSPELYKFNHQGDNSKFC
jgi:hypothetical protein